MCVHEAAGSVSYIFFKSDFFAEWKSEIKTCIHPCSYLVKDIQSSMLHFRNLPGWNLFYLPFSCHPPSPQMPIPHLLCVKRIYYLGCKSGWDEKDSWPVDSHILVGRQVWKIQISGLIILKIVDLYNFYFALDQDNFKVTLMSLL